MTSKQHQIESEQSDLQDDDQEQLNSNLLVFPKRIPIQPEKDYLIDEETFNKIKKLLTCPICLEIFVDPVYVKTCSHRFCKQCIERCLRASIKNKQCPSCRQPISTKRTLKEDLNVNCIISKIFPDLSAYKQKEQEISNKHFEKLYQFKKENTTITIPKRSISKRQESLQKDEELIQKKVHQEEEKIILEEDAYQSNQYELEQEIFNELNKVPNSQHEEVAEVIQLLQNDEIKININFILTLRLIVKPDDILTKQIDPDVNIFEQKIIYSVQEQAVKQHSKN